MKNRKLTKIKRRESILLHFEAIGVKIYDWGYFDKCFSSIYRVDGLIIPNIYDYQINAADSSQCSNRYVWEGNESGRGIWPKILLRHFQLRSNKNKRKAKSDSRGLFNLSLLFFLLQLLDPPEISILYLVLCPPLQTLLYRFPISAVLVQQLH